MKGVLRILVETSLDGTPFKAVCPDAELKNVDVSGFLEDLTGRFVEAPNQVIATFESLDVFSSTGFMRIFSYCVHKKRFKKKRGYSQCVFIYLSIGMYIITQNKYKYIHFKPLQRMLKFIARKFEKLPALNVNIVASTWVQAAVR
jgi:hypothetical protein